MRRWRPRAKCAASRTRSNTQNNPSPQVFLILGSCGVSAANSAEPDLVLIVGDSFNHLRISRLDEFARLLAQWPRARAFVEIKPHSLSEHDIQRVITVVSTFTLLEIN